MSKINVLKSIENNQKSIEETGRELRRLRLKEIENNGRGNCLFLSLGTLLFNDPSKHRLLREEANDYLRQNGTLRNEIITNPNETVDEYLDRLRLDGEYGSAAEITAIALKYEIGIDLHLKHNFNQITPFNIDHSTRYKLMYYDLQSFGYEHYTAIVKKDGLDAKEKDILTDKNNNLNKNVKENKENLSDKKNKSKIENPTSAFNEDTITLEELRKMNKERSLDYKIITEEFEIIYTGKARDFSYPNGHLQSSVQAHELGIILDPNLPGAHVKTLKFKLIKEELITKKKKVGIIRFNKGVSQDLSEFSECLFFNYPNKYKSKSNISKEKQNLKKIPIYKDENRLRILNDLVKMVDECIESDKIQWWNVDQVKESFKKLNLNTKEMMEKKFTSPGKLQHFMNGYNKKIRGVSRLSKEDKKS